MKEKTERFELRLNKQEFEALYRLAANQGTNRSDLLASYIRRMAKRRGLWQ